MNLNAFKVSFYRFSYCYHLWVWRIGWILAGSIVFCALAAIGQAFVSHPQYELLWSSLVVFVALTIPRLVTLWGRASAIKAVERLADFMSKPPIDLLWWILWIGAIAGLAIAFGSMGMWRGLSAWLQGQTSSSSTGGDWNASTRSYRPSIRDGAVSTGNLRPKGPVESFWISLGVLQVFILAWLAALVIWLLISSWHSIWFRYLALWFCLALGRLRRWLVTGWRGAVMVLAATTLLAWIYSQFLGARRALIEFLTPSLLQQVLVILGVLVVLYWVASARRRLTIVSFTDYTGEAALKASVDSISGRLLNELASLATLYQSVESFGTPSVPETKDKESKDTRKTTGDRYTTLYAVDIGQTLQGIITTDSRVKVGLVDIPIGLLAATLGRIVEGPRLSGSLQRVGNQLTLLAAIGGGGLQGNWRVSQSDLDQDDLPAAGDMHIIDRLVNQLAFRIFTDLEQHRLGTVRWRAVRLFTHGLRAYRDAAQSKQDRIVNLSRAEKAFVRALSFDEKFAQCHYNLGITLLNLGKAEAARVAFTQAGQADPTFLDAYYALAEHYWGSIDEADWWAALRYCDHILQMQADEARAWRLKGMALRRLNRARGLPPSRLVKERAWAIETCSIAVMLAWQRLCRSALGGDVSQGQKERTARYVLTLGLLTGDARGSDEAALYRQALYLSPGDANLHANLGGALEQKGKWTNAAREFERAAEISNDRRYWIEVILARRRRRSLPQGFWQRLRLTRWLDLSPSSAAAVSWGWQRILELATDLEKDDFEQVMPRLGTPPPDRVIEVRRVCAVRRWLQIKQGEWKLLREQEDELNKVVADRAALDKILIKRKALIKKIEQRRDYYERRKRYWSASQVVIQLAKMTQGSVEAVKYLHQAIEWMEQGKFAQDTQELRLHSRLVEMGTYGDWLAAPARAAEREIVLNAAEQAAALTPDDPRVRQQLGRICVLAHQLERAEAELTTSLLLAPNDPTTVEWLALTHWTRAMSAVTAETRRDAFRRAVTAFIRVLELVEGQSPPDHRYHEEKWAQARGWAHWWLGRFYRELLDYDAAATHLETACSLGYAPAEAKLELGRIYLRCRAYDQAEACLRDVIQCDPQTVDVHYSTVEREHRQPEEYAALAQLYLALAWAERGVSLTQALGKAGEAARFIRHMNSSEEERRPKIVALRHQCVGWIHLRARQLGHYTKEVHKARRLNLAVKHLELAVTLTSDADAYYRLGKAYSEFAQSEPKNELWVVKAREAYRHCKEADLRGEYIAEIDKLLAPPAQPKAKPDVLVEVNRKD